MTASPTTLFARTSPDSSQPPRPDPEALARLHELYDASARLVRGVSPTRGYHSDLPTGTAVHETRTSATYAHALLRSSSPEDRERGRLVLGRVLDLQDTDPLSPWYGLWSWFLEEPLAAMRPADWNWADFIGATLADILLETPGDLGTRLESAARDALGHAAWSIFRRNVSLDYTNIAALGSGVTLAAGRILGQPVLLDYGRRRVRALRQKVEAAGGFAEYNSPTYSMVTLVALEHVLRVTDDPETLEHAEWLRVFLLRLVADQFHPGTGQWAGAQSRSYSDWLGGWPYAALCRRLGFSPPRRHAREHPEPSALGLEVLRPVPTSLLGRFRALPADPHEQVQVWTRRADGSPDKVTTTWFTADATLGSVNRELAWSQPRPVVAYWRAEGELAARGRVRVLYSGKDYAAGQLLAAQRGPALVGAARVLAGEGTHHPHFDKPPGGVYALDDLRVRFEVEGRGARIEARADGSWVLAVGSSGLLLRAGPSWFDGAAAARWVSGGEGETVWVEAVLYSGPARSFDPARAGRTLVTYALALVEDLRSLPPLSAPDVSEGPEAWLVSGAPLGRPLQLHVPSVSNRR